MAARWASPLDVFLRRLRAGQVPIIYLFGPVPGKYLPTWPVFFEADHPAELEVSIRVDDVRHFDLFRAGPEAYGAASVGEGTDVRPAYVTAQVRRRVHQRTFRARGLAGRLQ
jgi:putative restriction endonuclease